MTKTLEQRVKELERKVAELEIKLQEQPEKIVAFIKNIEKARNMSVDGKIELIEKQ